MKMEKGYAMPAAADQFGCAFKARECEGEGDSRRMRDYEITLRRRVVEEGNDQPANRVRKSLLDA